MDVLFACQSATCPERGVVISFLCEAVRDPRCECGAVLEPVELEDGADRRAA